MVSQLAKAGAAAVFGVIVFTTLGPVADRPHLMGDPQGDRFFAYAALGVALGVAYPRHRVWTGFGAVLLAVGLEAGQFLIPHRDPRLVDAMAKALGALVGWGCAQVVNVTRARLARSQAGSLL